MEIERNERGQNHQTSTLTQLLEYTYGYKGKTNNENRSGNKQIELLEITKKENFTG